MPTDVGALCSWLLIIKVIKSHSFYTGVYANVHTARFVNFFLLGISPHAWGSHGIVHCQSIGLVSGRIGDPLSPILRTTEDPCLGMGTSNKNKLYTPGMHVAVHIWQPRVTMGTKMGGLLLKKYTSIFYKACIPLGPFSKLDKQALWKRAKWCRLILHGSW